MADHPNSSEPAIRCMLQQVALPKYKVPYYLALSRRPGMDLTVVYGTADLPNAEVPEGLKVVYRKLTALPGKLWWDGEYKKLLKRGAYDAISLSWNTRQLALLPSMIKAKRNGIGVVLWGHGYSKNEGAIRSWVRKRIALLADAVVTYTPSVAKRYVEDGMPAEKVYCALNSLDQTEIQAARLRWSDDTDRLEAWKRENAIGDGPVLLFVSRLFEPNRTDLLIEAASKLRQRHPGIIVAIVGKGPDHDRLVRVTNDLGMADHVRFLGAIYSEEHLAPWFLVSKAFCYPRNIGLSILHAMGYGLPVVTCDHIPSHNPEIDALKDGENGLFYRDGDIDHLAQQLDRLCTDAALQRRLSEGALRTATEEFTIERMADGMENALRYAAKKARERASAGRGRLAERSA
jgi:glycosyltransferase involved in cell wall biosynthesis